MAKKKYAYVSIEYVIICCMIYSFIHQLAEVWWNFQSVCCPEVSLSDSITPLIVLLLLLSNIMNTWIGSRTVGETIMVHGKPTH